MSGPVPTFSGEVQFRRYSDTSTQGASIVLSLSDRDELSQFIGKEGKRFMAVLVEIGDDEKPVSYPPGSVVEADRVGNKLVPKLGPLAYWLVMRCNEPEFWAFLNSEYHPMGSLIESSGDASSLVKSVLGVRSRKEVDGDKIAETRCKTLIMHSYQKWLVRRGVTA